MPLAVVALAGQSVFLGYNWVVMKQGLHYADPWAFTALRTSLGAVALFVVLAVLRRPMRPTQPRLTALLGLLQTTGMIGLLMWAFQSGAAGRVSALVYTMPFWAMMLGWVLPGRTRHGAALAGRLLLARRVWCWCSTPRTSGAACKASCWPSPRACRWAASAIVVKRIRARGPTDVINLTAWQMLYGSIPIIIIAHLHHLPAHRVDRAPSSPPWPTTSSRRRR